MGSATPRGRLARRLCISTCRTTLKVPQQRGFQASQTVVFYSTVNFRNDIPLLLSNGIRVVIYEGVEDLICKSVSAFFCVGCSSCVAGNYFGAGATLATLNWSGQSGFNQAANSTWTVGGTKAGSVRTFMNLTYVNVLAAGEIF